MFTANELDLILRTNVKIYKLIYELYNHNITNISFS